MPDKNEKNGAKYDKKRLNVAVYLLRINDNGDNKKRSKIWQKGNQLASSLKSANTIQTLKHRRIINTTSTIASSHTTQVAKQSNT